MTDEELIERLRGWMTSSSFDDDAHAAADRIEELRRRALIAESKVVTRSAKEPKS